MSKSIITAVIYILSGIGVLTGNPLDDTTMTGLGEHLNTLVGSGMFVTGIVMTVLRNVTKSPLVTWWGKK